MCLGAFPNRSSWSVPWCTVEHLSGNVTKTVYSESEYHFSSLRRTLIDDCKDVNCFLGSKKGSKGLGFGCSHVPLFLRFVIGISLNMRLNSHPRSYARSHIQYLVDGAPLNNDCASLIFARQFD